MGKAQKTNHRRRFQHILNTSKKSNRKSGGGKQQRRRKSTKNLRDSKRSKRRTVRNNKNRGGTILESLGRCLGPLCRSAPDAVVAPEVAPVNQPPVSQSAPQVERRSSSIKLDDIEYKDPPPISKLNVIKIAVFFAGILLRARYYEHELLFKVTYIVVDFVDSNDDFLEHNDNQQCLIYDMFSNNCKLINYINRLEYIGCLLIQKYNLDVRRGYIDVSEIESKDIKQALDEDLLHYLYHNKQITDDYCHQIYFNIARPETGYKPTFKNICHSAYNKFIKFLLYWNDIPNGIGNETWGLAENRDKSINKVFRHHGINPLISVVRDPDERTNRPRNELISDDSDLDIQSIINSITNLQAHILRHQIYETKLKEIQK